MSGLAGEQSLAPYYDEAQDTSPSSTTTTTEIVTDTLAATLVDGEDYDIDVSMIYNSSVAADEVTINLREGTTTSGTVLDSTRVYLPSTSGVYRGTLYALYTAGATGAQSFVATVVRVAGSGNCRRYASSTAPATIKIRLRN